MIITNTKFTSDAIAYSECAGIDLISWGYPKYESLESLINKYNLHPISCLSRLAAKELRSMLNAGIVLCEDLNVKNLNLKSLGIPKGKLDLLINECAALSL